MFLAFKEILSSKRKFGLIIALIALITYLVYFLTALAYGLASSYTNGIDKVGANKIVMSSDSNDNIMMSMLDENDFRLLNVSNSKAKLGLFPAVVLNENDANQKLDAYLFGVEDINFYISEYQGTLEYNEAIVDSELEREGFKIGDKVRLSGSETSFIIKGFVEKRTYQTAPIVFINLDLWREHRFNNKFVETFNAILVKGEINSSGDLRTYDIKEFNNTLPGYLAQVLTFSLMIGFLILIIAFVLGIFIYVLTIQKVSMFGVMKAQGISNEYISLSVLNQTFLIVLIGTIIGLALTLISGFFLSGIVPFAVNYLFFIVITIAYFIFPLISGLFSVSTITKIDPIKAIG